ncbi:hypothetical protein Bca4012_074025 [Brassica carinata]
MVSKQSSASRNIIWHIIERSKRQSECIGFGKEEEEAAEAEVLERWPEKDNLKECQCHKRGPMAHRVKSGKRKKLKQKELGRMKL